MMRPIAVVTALAAVLAAAVVFWLARDPGQVDDARTPPAAEQAPAVADSGEAGVSPSADDTAETSASEPEAPTPPKGFCERDFEDVAAREADVDALQAAGGLVYIFEREARLDDPYGCADFYLEHGLDVDAVDPRENQEPITGLFYAIQRNDPEMLRFMLEHGADPSKRAGENDIRPTGYAYSLAMRDQRIDRNEIIGMLDEALQSSD